MDWKEFFSGGIFSMIMSLFLIFPIILLLFMTSLLFFDLYFKAGIILGSMTIIYIFIAIYIIVTKIESFSKTIKDILLAKFSVCLLCISLCSTVFIPSLFVLLAGGGGVALSGITILKLALPFLFLFFVGLGLHIYQLVQHKKQGLPLTEIKCELPQTRNRLSQILLKSYVHILLIFILTIGLQILFFWIFVFLQIID